MNKGKSSTNHKKAASVAQPPSRSTNKGKEQDRPREDKLKSKTPAQASLAIQKAAGSKRASNGNEEEDAENRQAIGGKGETPLKIEKKQQSKSKRPPTPVIIPSSDKMSTVKKSDTTQGCDKRKKPNESSGRQSPEGKKSILGKRPQDTSKGGSLSPTKVSGVKQKVSKVPEQTSASKVKRDVSMKQVVGSSSDAKISKVQKGKSSKQKTSSDPSNKAPSQKPDTVPKKAVKTTLDLSKRLQAEDGPKIWKPESKFQGVTLKSAETEVCHFSFRIMKYPDEKKFVTKNKQCLTVKQREFMQLYRLVYCVDCCIPVYWMCLSDNTQVQEITLKKKQYLVFKCDCCVAKSKGHEKKGEIRCVECKNRGGYMKKILGSEGYIHPICALTYPNIYQLGRPSNMNIKLCTGVEPSTEPSGECNICCKKTPRMLKCKDFDDFGKYAHAYCIMNKNKEIIYQVDMRQKYEFEDQFPNKWSFQLFFKDSWNSSSNNFDKLSGGYDSSSSNASLGIGAKGKNNGPQPGSENFQSPFIRVLCNEQRNQNTLCYCENSAADKDNVTQCSACFTWYHQDCWGDHVDIQDGGPSKLFKKQYSKEQEEGAIDQSDPESDAEMLSEKDFEEGGEDEQDEMDFNKIQKGSVEKQDDFLICDKCIEFNRLSKSAFADVILGKKTIENYLPSFQDNWSSSKKLTQLPPCDFRTKATFEFSIFEHVMLYKFWYKILQQSSEKKLHEDLYKDILSKSQVHIFNNQELNNLLQKKLKESSKINEESYRETFFFKEVFKLNSEKLNEENIQYNIKELDLLKSHINNRLKHQVLITNKTQVYYDQYLEAINLQKIAEIYKSDHADAKIVKNLLNSLRSLPNFSCTQSLSFKKLDHDHNLFLDWENKILKMVKDSGCQFSENQIPKEFKKLIPTDITPSGLSQIRYDFLKSLFQNKISVSYADQFIQSGKTLFVQNPEIFKSIKDKIDMAQQSQDIKKVVSYPKPVKVLTQHICQIAQSIVKPPDINELLTKQRNSQMLRYQCKSFLSDTFEKNKLWMMELFQKGIFPNQVIDEYEVKKTRKKTLRQKFWHLVFNNDNIQELENKINDKEYIIDASMKENVRRKIKKIRKLQGEHLAVIKSEDATQTQIVDYIKEIKCLQNVDLDYQLDLAEKKLSILRLGQRCIHGGSLIPDDQKAKVDNNSKNNSSGKKSGTAMAVRDEQQSFLSQQSLNYFQDIENLKSILESSDSKDLKDVSNKACKNADVDYFDEEDDDNLYSIIDPESAYKVVDELSPSKKQKYLEYENKGSIDQDDLMKAIQILETRKQGVQKQ